MVWQLDGELPAGIKFDSKTGTFSGKIKEVNDPDHWYDYGTTGITVTLSNPVGQVSKTFSLNVDGIPPKITTSKLNAGTYGKTYSAVIKASGTKPIQFCCAEELPDGLTLDCFTGKITGTPLEVCTNRRIVITASNEFGFEDKEFYLTIKAVNPQITTKALPDVLVNEEYSTTVEATGTPEITFTAEGLPPGLNITSDGQISGTPTAFGTFPVKITAANSAKSVKKTLKLNVLSAPKFNDISTLNQGTEKKAYSHKFGVLGTGTIAFSLTGGSLPVGLSLNTKKGKLSGTPKEAGTFTFTITAKNSVGEDSKEFSLTVASKAAKNNKAVQDYYALSEELDDGGCFYDLQENNSILDGESNFSGETLVVAQLEPVSVDVSGLYDFTVKLSDDVEQGAMLVWLANSSEPSDDDAIAEFSDASGREIDAVPDDRIISVSVWLNPDRVYHPAIAVSR